MHRSSLAILLTGVVLLAAGLLVTAGAVAQGRQQDETMQRDATQVALAFSSYFERARSLDLLLAQNPAFTPGEDVPFDHAAADRALEYLEQLFPGTIGEACIIDETGQELARVTEGVPAPASELSSEEEENEFFDATLALKPGQVHQAEPYVSPDTRKWVISNSTWIRQADGSPLIVHFEVSLETFRPYLTETSAGQHVAVVERSTGRTILQNGVELPSIDPAGAFPVFAAAEQALSGAEVRTGSAAEAGQRLALSEVARTEGNANDWVVAEWSDTRASVVPAWAGVVTTVVGIALVLLFLLVNRRQEGVLLMAARLDHLTGMSNRKALEEALNEAVAAAAQPGADRVAVLMLDLDGFKQINDTLGHEKGDQVLQEIARRLHSSTLEYDTAARLGGDEFAVVLRRLRRADDVSAVAHRLRDALIRPIDIDGVPRFIGASIGAAVYAEHGRSSAELLRAADAAMYRAKRGREGVRVCDVGTEAGADALGLAAELLLAIENEELTLVFQPTYMVGTGEVVGVEALSRWRRPGNTEVPPAHFIPLAEHTGLIRQLTRLTLQRALDEAKAWQLAGVAVPVSVNLSAQLVADRSLPSEVTAMLAERGLTGRALVLEITETAIMRDLAVAIEVLHALRALGVRVELDDFGSGYASFKALHELPLDGVKVDHALVNDTSTGGQRLLAATIDIGARLGLKVVAEGIEDEATLDLVRRLGADTAQGDYLARPMGAPALCLLLLRARMATAP